MNILQGDALNAADVKKALTTPLRCPGIQNGDNTTYFLTKEGTQPSKKNIDRAGIAQCMADMIEDETLGCNV